MIGAWGVTPKLGETYVTKKGETFVLSAKVGALFELVSRSRGTRTFVPDAWFLFVRHATKAETKADIWG